MLKIYRLYLHPERPTNYFCTLYELRPPKLFDTPTNKRALRNIIKMWRLFAPCTCVWNEMTGEIISNKKVSNKVYRCYIPTNRYIPVRISHNFDISTPNANVYSQGYVLSFFSNTRKTSENRTLRKTEQAHRRRLRVFSRMGHRQFISNSSLSQRRPAKYKQYIIMSCIMYAKTTKQARKHKQTTGVIVAHTIIPAKSQSNFRD